MTSVSFDGSEMNRLAADLQRGSLRTAQAVSRVVRATAARVESEAKQFAPVDTGNLRSSIGTDIVGGGTDIEAQIGPSAAYGAFVELGTSRSAPHAYLGPAFDRAQPDFVAAIGKISEETL